MKKLLLGSVLLGVSIAQIGCDQVAEFSHKKTDVNPGSSGGGDPQSGISIQLPTAIVQASKVRTYGAVESRGEMPDAIPPIQEDEEVESDRISLTCSEPAPLRPHKSHPVYTQKAESLASDQMNPSVLSTEGCEVKNSLKYRPIAWIDISLTERIGKKLIQESVSLPFDCVGHTQLMLRDLNPASEYQVSAVLVSGFDASIVYQGSTKTFSGNADLSSVKLVMRRHNGGGIDIIFDDEEPIEPEMLPGHATIECALAEGSKLNECRGEFYRLPMDGREIIEIVPVSCVMEAPSNSCKLEVKGIGRLSISDACGGVFEMKIHSGESSYSSIKICSNTPSPVPMPKPPEPSPSPRPVVR
jgi:hypothetical protein